MTTPETITAERNALKKEIKQVDAQLKQLQQQLAIVEQQYQ